jgi:uncharacterized damage-inducible protein DinB
MNAAAFRHLYDYHFATNRFLWDTYIVPLTHAQFTQASSYSHGSVRDQLVHLVNVDDVWFSDLSGQVPAESLDPAQVVDRAAFRAHWDAVEQRMRAYLAHLTDDMLNDQPLQGEDKDLRVWQVLLHIANHGTDHRAQILRLLSDLGVQTTSQDYVFYAYEHP